MTRLGMFSTLVRFAPAALLVLSAPAQGAPMRYNFDGVITLADKSTGVSVGDRFIGSLIYDDQAPKKPGSPGTSGSETFQYSFSGTHREQDPTPDGTGLEVSVGERTFTAPSTGLTTSYSRWSSSAESGSYMTFSGHEPKGVAPGAWLSLTSPNGDAFPNGMLVHGLSLSDFSSATVAVERSIGSAYPQDGTASPYLLMGKLSNFEPAPVPEPAWTVAALLGAAFWASRRRRHG